MRCVHPATPHAIERRCNAIATHGAAHIGGYTALCPRHAVAWDHKVTYPHLRCVRLEAMSATPQLSEEETRAVPCSLCGAPISQWCSRSRARRSGGSISTGDWRTAHAARQQAALQKVDDDHRRRRQ